MLESDKKNSQPLAPPPVSASPQVPMDELLSMAKKNEQLLQELHKYMKRTQLMGTISLVIKIVFIVLPVIAAIVVLPKLFSQLSASYGQQGIQLNQLFNTVQELKTTKPPN